MTKGVAMANKKLVDLLLQDENANVEFILKIFDFAFEIHQYPTGLTFHSDPGTQYTAFKFRKHLRKLGVNQSFSNPGTPLDNAIAESFFACMKREKAFSQLL